MMPPARLDRAPWRARPTATPAEASTATTEAMGTPRIPMMEITRITYRPIRTKLTTKVWTVPSTFFRPLLLATSFTTFLMSALPTMRTTRARMILPPTAVASSIRLEMKASIYILPSVFDRSRPEGTAFAHFCFKV